MYLQVTIAERLMMSRKETFLFLKKLLYEVSPSPFPDIQ